VTPDTAPRCLCRDNGSAGSTGLTARRFPPACRNALRSIEEEEEEEEEEEGAADVSPTVSVDFMLKLYLVSIFSFYSNYILYNNDIYYIIY